MVVGVRDDDYQQGCRMAALTLQRQLSGQLRWQLSTQLHRVLVARLSRERRQLSDRLLRDMAAQ